MTNSPTFEKQQENLKQYQGFGGNKPIPGTSSAQDRFVRASYYMLLFYQNISLRLHHQFFLCVLALYRFQVFLYQFLLAYLLVQIYCLHIVFFHKNIWPVKRKKPTCKVPLKFPYCLHK